MTPLLDRPITATSDNGACLWHAAKLWQTHAIKYEIIDIKINLYHKLHAQQVQNVLKFGLLIFFKFLNLKT